MAKAYGRGQICLRQEVSRRASDGKSLGAVKGIPVYEFHGESVDEA
jgi:hypothetical protein